MTVDEQRREARILLFEEIASERRSRREPEHLLIGAYVAFAGGAMWGVATLKAVAKDNLDAIRAAMYGSIAIAIVSVIKIIHSGTRHDRCVRTLRALANELGLDDASYPDYLLQQPPPCCWMSRAWSYLFGGGRKISVFIIVVSMAAVIWFCRGILPPATETTSSAMSTPTSDTDQRRIVQNSFHFHLTLSPQSFPKIENTDLDYPPPPPTAVELPKK